MTFFRNFFLAAGIIWTLSALSILTFKLNFGQQEIIISLLFPLAYAIVKIFEKRTETASLKNT